MNRQVADLVEVRRRVPHTRGDELKANQQSVITDPTGCGVLANARAFDHMAGLDGKGGDKYRKKHALAVDPTFASPDEIWLHTYRYPEGRIVLRKAYVK